MSPFACSGDMYAGVPTSEPARVRYIAAGSWSASPSSAAEALEALKKIREEVASAPPEPVEQLSKSDGLSTLSGAKKSEPPTSPSSTSIAYGDVTPAVTPRSNSILTRRIPRSLAASVLGAVLIGVIATAAAIRASTPATREDLISAQMLKEFEYKELAMNSARALYMNGKYQDAINAYDEYIKRYPYATAAVAERAEAQSALNESQIAKAKLNVTAKRTAKPEPKKEEPKKGFFRRIFGRG